MKIVINTCFGGFSISDAAVAEYFRLTGKEITNYGHNFNEEDDFWTVERNDPALVEIVEQMGERADGDAARLKVVEIPEGIDWYISDYDGVEHIAEPHRTWS